jgi:hypothetical protein
MWGVINLTDSYFMFRSTVNSGEYQFLENPVQCRRNSQELSKVNFVSMLFYVQVIFFSQSTVKFPDQMKSQKFCLTSIWLKGMMLWVTSAWKVNMIEHLCYSGCGKITPCSKGDVEYTKPFSGNGKKVPLRFLKEA